MITLDEIQSNNNGACAHCGCVVFPLMDSGWEVFVGDGKTTQRICKLCFAEMENEEKIKVNEDEI